MTIAEVVRDVLRDEHADVMREFVGVAYAKVAEFQARGVHFHAIVHLDGA